jgi:stage V sporulation protein AB
MDILNHAVPVLVGFTSGMVVSGAVIAFITAIGVVPRLAQKTGTAAYAKTYEMAIAVGALFGTLAGFAGITIPLGGAFMAPFGLLAGIFYGVLAMSLAEVLNVIPILARRSGLRSAVSWFILAVAAGKVTGALLYIIVPGFFSS